jgi:predicted anti-sigma-YlaC factor YlaD
MDPSRFEMVLERILKTEEEELDCSECFDSVSAYVEGLLGGEPQTGQMRRVKQHLEQCRVCREEFETLYELTRWEREAKAHSPGD